MVDTEKASKPSDGRVKYLETAESISKILSAVAIPIVLAFVGFAVQGRLLTQAAQREYVGLAVSILQETDEKKAPPELKQWAAILLDQNSPVKLPPKLLASLQSGNTTLPTNRPFNGVSGSFGVTPDAIRRGESATLQWNSFNASNVTIAPNIGTVPLEGSIVVRPLQTTTYTITISNSFSETDAKATVVVLEPATDPLPRSKNVP